MWGQPHGHGCGFDQSKLGRYLGDIWADLGVFRRIWADLGSIWANLLWLTTLFLHI